MGKKLICMLSLLTAFVSLSAINNNPQGADVSKNKTNMSEQSYWQQALQTVSAQLEKVQEAYERSIKEAAKIAQDTEQSFYYKKIKKLKKVVEEKIAQQIHNVAKNDISPEVQEKLQLFHENFKNAHDFSTSGADILLAPHVELKSVSMVVQKALKDKQKAEQKALAQKQKMLRLKQLSLHAEQDKKIKLGLESIVKDIKLAKNRLLKKQDAEAYALYEKQNIKRSEINRKLNNKVDAEIRKITGNTWLDKLKFWEKNKLPLIDIHSNETFLPNKNYTPDCIEGSVDSEKSIVAVQPAQKSEHIIEHVEQPTLKFDFVSVKQQPVEQVAAVSQKTENLVQEVPIKTDIKVQEIRNKKISGQVLTQMRAHADNQKQVNAYLHDKIVQRPISVTEEMTSWQHFQKAMQGSYDATSTFVGEHKQAIGVASLFAAVVGYGLYKNCYFNSKKQMVKTIMPDVEQKPATPVASLPVAQKQPQVVAAKAVPVKKQQQMIKRRKNRRR